MKILNLLWLCLLLQVGEVHAKEKMSNVGESYYSKVKGLFEAGENVLFEEVNSFYTTSGRCYKSEAPNTPVPSLLRITTEYHSSYHGPIGSKINKMFFLSARNEQSNYYDGASQFVVSYMIDELLRAQGIDIHNTSCFRVWSFQGTVSSRCDLSHTGFGIIRGTLRKNGDNLVMILNQNLKQGDNYIKEAHATCYFFNKIKE